MMSLNAVRQAGKLSVSIIIVSGLTRQIIELGTIVSVADALATRPLNSFLSSKDLKTCPNV